MNWEVKILEIMHIGLTEFLIRWTLQKNGTDYVSGETHVTPEELDGKTKQEKKTYCIQQVKQQVNTYIASESHVNDIISLKGFTFNPISQSLI